MSFDLKTYLEDAKTLIESAFDGFFPSGNGIPARLKEAMNYSLLAGGKRIRPVLCFASAEACGGKKEDVLRAALALEMIHSFSLVHDDLPAMDDDDLRRGRPTNHKIFGEATAILAGDGLLCEAFSILTGLSEGGLTPGRVVEVIRDVAQAAGPQGMVGGQILDMEAEGKEIEVDDLTDLHNRKTGRLISVSATSGAKLVTLDEGKISAIKHYGDSIGLAFQITDDILDREGGSAWGKKVGGDQKRGKATFPSLMGLEEARKKAFSLVDRAVSQIEPLGPAAEPLRAVARYVVERKG